MIELNSFKVVRYRGIDGLSIPRLSKTNLVTGFNGVGKTALIEAMWLFTGRYNPSLLWNANLLRTRGSPANPLSRLTEGELELHGTENGEAHELKLAFEEIDGTPRGELVAGTMQDDLRRLAPAVGFLRTHLDGKLVQGGPGGVHLTSSGAVLYDSPDTPAGRPGCIIESTRLQHETSDEDLGRYSGLVREGRKDELVKAIGLVAPGAEEVEILKDASGDSYLSVTVSGGRPRPLHDLGGGAVRLARLLIGIFAAKGAILLSDELEGGIHHSAQREVWDRARQWMDLWDVQLVATTHSAEFLEAAIDAFSDRPEDLSVHRLHRDPETRRPKVATFTGDALAGARNLDLEIR